MEYNTGNVTGRLQMSKSINVIFYIFDFRQELTCAHDCHKHTHTRTHIHTHTHTHKQLHDMAMANRKIYRFA